MIKVTFPTTTKTPSLTVKTVPIDSNTRNDTDNTCAMLSHWHD